MRPTKFVALSAINPCFAKPIVTVKSATTQSRSALPESLSSPVGTSTAKTNACSSRRRRLISRQAARNGSRKGGVAPRPSKPSRIMTPEGCASAASFSAWTRFLLQTAQFFSHQFAAILFRKREPRFDLPTCTREMFRGDQRVAGVVALACENDASARHWKKSRDRACDARARLIHQFFRRDAAREGGIFRCAHLRDSQNG